MCSTTGTGESTNLSRTGIVPGPPSSSTTRSVPNTIGMAPSAMRPAGSRQERAVEVMTAS